MGSGTYLVPIWSPNYQKLLNEIILKLGSRSPYLIEVPVCICTVYVVVQYMCDCAPVVCIHVQYDVCIRGVLYVCMYACMYVQVCEYDVQYAYESKLCVWMNVLYMKYPLGVCGNYSVLTPTHVLRFNFLFLLCWSTIFLGQWFMITNHRHRHLN